MIQEVKTLKLKLATDYNNKSFLIQRTDAIAILKYIEELEKERNELIKRK